MKIQRDPDGEWQARRPQRLKSKNPFQAFVIGVPDGDCIQISTDLEYVSAKTIEYIRIAYIDAPELRSMDAVRAVRAQLALQRMVYQKVVTVTPRRIWRDPYNRIIASVTVAGADVGACLVAAGFAKIRRSTKPLQTPDHPKT